MRTEAKTINFNEKEFKIKKENKYKIYYKCCHWNDIKCKAIIMFVKILNQYELITNHNARCKKLFNPMIEKNENVEFFQENNLKSYDKINNTVSFFQDSCQFTRIEKDIKMKINKSIEKEVEKRLESEKKKLKEEWKEKLMNEIKFNEIKFQLEGKAKSVKQSVSFGDNISAIEKKSNNAISLFQSCLETNATEIETFKQKENHEKRNFDNNTKIKRELIRKILSPTKVNWSGFGFNRLEEFREKIEKKWKKKFMQNLEKNNAKYFCKKRWGKTFLKYGNKFKCNNCSKLNCIKNFHRHIDECNQSSFEKNFCLFCHRDIVEKIEFDDKILHKHSCSRKKKKKKLIKKPSYLRWKRRMKGEKFFLRNFKQKPIFGLFFDVLFVNKIVNNFVNQKRNSMLLVYNGLKEGYPEEYLDLYSSTNTYIPFEKMFASCINEIGRLYKIDYAFEITNPTDFMFLEEKLKKKYEKNFKYLNGKTSEEETILIEKEIQMVCRIYKKKIPKWIKTKISNDMELTYVLACSQRREIDRQLNENLNFI
jgi:hypothetical protein